MRSYEDFDFNDEGKKAAVTGWKRHLKTIYSVAGVAGVISLTAALAPKKSNGPVRKQQESIVAIAPPPPPPPVVAPPPEPQEQDMVKQDEVKDEPEDTPDDTPAVAATGTGAGPNFGLKARNAPKKLTIGGGLGAWDKFALSIKNDLGLMLKKNPTINRKMLTIQVRLWSDSTGHITKASLVKGTGDSVLDQAIKDNVLVGLQLPSAPPPDLPMPINLKISAQRPS